MEASEQEEAETKKGGKSGGKATQKGSRGSSAAPTRQDGMHDRLESIREFIAEMKEREKGRTKGRVDYATRVMFDKAEEDVEVLAALVSECSLFTNYQFRLEYRSTWLGRLARCAEQVKAQDFCLWR